MEKKNLPKRKANRLANYDYDTNGMYFITVCTKNKQRILSEIAVGGDDPGAPQVLLSEYGAVVERNLLKMDKIYSAVSVERYVIMPNHIHLLLRIGSDLDCTNGAPRSSPPTNTVSRFVTALKKFTNKESGSDLWQRGFYDHIIRDDEDYLIKSEYIDKNPMNWLLKRGEDY